MSTARSTLYIILAFFFLNTSLVACKKDEKQPVPQLASGSETEASTQTTPVAGANKQTTTDGFEPSNVNQQGSEQFNSKIYSHRMNKLADSGHRLLTAFRKMKTTIRYDMDRGMPICSSPDGCGWSEGVGNIVTESGTCVATLIDKDLIITAAHCFPNKETGSRVTGNFKLPALKGLDGRTIDQESLSLANVLAMSNEEKDGVDFIIVRLADEARKHRPLELSRDGFSHRKKYMTIGKDLVQGSSNFGKWNLRKNCYSSFSNLMIPEFNHAKSKFVYLGDCPIAAGNSGAPILTQDRKVVGIVRGHMRPQKVSMYRNFLKSMGFMKGDKPSFSTAATNIACVPDVISGKPLVTKDCDLNNPQLEKSNVRPVKSSLSKKIEDELKVIGGEQDGKFVKMMDHPNNVFSIMRVFVPNCVNYEKLPTLEGKKYQLSAVYSPMVDSRFDITEELSEPSMTVLMFSENDKSPTSYEVKYELTEGAVLYKGQIPSCD